VRGPVDGLSDDVWVLSLDDGDQAFLKENMPVFLGKIGRSQLEKELTDFSEWQKIVAKTYEERNIRSRTTLREFRTQKWVGEGGIFADVVKDDYAHIAGLVNVGADRIKIPHWQDKRFGAPCARENSRKPSNWSLNTRRSRPVFVVKFARTSVWMLVVVVTSINLSP
jgi:hypothetical protein